MELPTLEAIQRNSPEHRGLLRYIAARMESLRGQSIASTIPLDQVPALRGRYLELQTLLEHLPREAE